MRRRPEALILRGLPALVFLTGCAFVDPAFFDRRIVLVNTADRRVVAAIVEDSGKGHSATTTAIAPGERAEFSASGIERRRARAILRLTFMPLTKDGALDPASNTIVEFPLGSHRYQLSLDGDQVVATESATDTRGVPPADGR